MDRKFIITSGFCSSGSCPYPWDENTDRHKLMKGNEFHELWEHVLLNNISITPEQITIIDSTDQKNVNQSYSKMRDRSLLDWIDMSSNFGHQIGEIKGQYCGWTRSWLLGMFYAWINDCDHFFVEQDVLIFGDWINAIYDKVEKNNREVMFGAKEYAGPLYAQEVGLTFIKKEVIPYYLRDILQIPDTDKQMGVEHKIAHVNERFRVGDHPFGYGFQKPDELGTTFPFYAHRWSFTDIKKLVDLKLIDKKYVSI